MGVDQTFYGSAGDYGCMGTDLWQGGVYNDKYLPDRHSEGAGAEPGDADRFSGSMQYRNFPDAALRIPVAYAGLQRFSGFVFILPYETDGIGVSGRRRRAAAFPALSLYWNSTVSVSVAVGTGDGDGSAASRKRIGPGRMRSGEPDDGCGYRFFVSDP